MFSVNLMRGNTSIELIGVKVSQGEATALARGWKQRFGFEGMERILVISVESGEIVYSLYNHNYKG